MYRVKQSKKKLMNERETIAYNWLRTIYNYNGKQIRYYSNSSPDFETLDGMLWEVKGTQPTFTYSQSIKLPWHTVILKVDKDNKTVIPILYYELPDVCPKPFNPPIKLCCVSHNQLPIEPKGLPGVVIGVKFTHPGPRPISKACIQFMFIPL